MVQLFDRRAGKAAWSRELHEKKVNTVSLHPTEPHYIVTASLDRTVKLWDAQNGACLQTLEGGSGHVKSVCSFDGGTQIASGNFDDTIKLWV